MKEFFISLLLTFALTTACFSQTRFYVVLNGASEVPPNASTAWGRGTMVLSADQDSLYYSIVWKLGNTYTNSHFHIGPVGVSGAAVFGLQNANATGAHGVWAIDAANLSRLFNDSVYANVHTNIFPNGEIRGQVYDSVFSDTTFEAHPRGTAEVPPNISTGWGLGLFWLSSDYDSIYSATMWRLQGAYSVSHIHVGPPGVNGAPWVALQNAGPTGSHGGLAIDALHRGRLYHDSLYCNAHSDLWPGGEIRDQLQIVMPPNPCEPPANDNCPGMVVNSNPFEHTGDITCAEFDFPHRLGGNGPDVFYRITTPCQTTVYVSTCQSTFDAKVDVHAATADSLGPFPCPPDSELTDDQRDTCVFMGENLRFSSGPNETHFIVVYGMPGAMGEYTLRVTASACPPEELVIRRNGNNMTLNWAPSAGADSYNIYQSATLPVPTDPAHLVGNTANSFFDVFVCDCDWRFFTVTAQSSP